MKIKLYMSLLLSISFLSISAQSTKTIQVEVNNPTSIERIDKPVVLNIDDLNLGFVPRSAVIMLGNLEIPSQLDDLTGNRKADELAFVVTIKPNEIQINNIVFSSEKIVQAYTPLAIEECRVMVKKVKQFLLHPVPFPGTGIIINQFHLLVPLFDSDWVRI